MFPLLQLAGDKHDNMATVTIKTKVLGIKGKVEAILQIENEKRKLTCVGNMV